MHCVNGIGSRLQLFPQHPPLILEFALNVRFKTRANVSHPALQSPQGSGAVQQQTGAVVEQLFQLPLPREEPCETFAVAKC